MRTIRACVESLLNQTYPKHLYDVIVVDNKSNDGTQDLITEYDVTLLHEEDRQTSYAARNKGISHTDAEIIAFTDADCVAHPEWLAHLIQPFADPNIGGVGGRVLNSDPENEVEQFIHSVGLFLDYHGESIFLPVLLGVNIAYRRDCLNILNGFNDRLFTGADVDLSWRLQLKTQSKVAYAPEAIIFHRHRSTLPGIARAYWRYGFSEVFLDAMYHMQPGYKRTLWQQLRLMLRQVWALIIYTLSYIYRSIRSIGGRKDPYYRQKPRYWFIIESNNLKGKIDALIATRFLRRNPAQSLWEDPGER